MSDGGSRSRLASSRSTPRPQRRSRFTSGPRAGDRNSPIPDIVRPDIVRSSVPKMRALSCRTLATDTGFRPDLVAPIRSLLDERDGEGWPIMVEEIKLKNPWLVAVWPGMGNVAISAGYYLMAKLGMHLLAEFPAGELFDVDHVEVKNGLIQPGRLPRSRLFVWNDPRGQHDLVVFIGEDSHPWADTCSVASSIEFAKASRCGTRLHVRGPGDSDASRQSVSRVRRRHRCRMPGRVEATGTGDDRRRPDWRSEWRASRGGSREWLAGSLPAGGDAAYLRPGSLPEGGPGGSRSVRTDGRSPA